MLDLYALQPEYADKYLNTVETVGVDERSAAFNRFGDESLPSIINHTDGNSEASIIITGPLSSAGPSPIARFFGFGGTGYIDIIAAAKKLGDDPTVEKVRLQMNTPGGGVDGMDQAWQALKELASKKTLIAENHGTIASAGYYLATAAPKIVAMSPLVQTGSIGIVKAGLDFTDALARGGIKRIKIISSNAPDKQADPTTPRGLQVHQDEIDASERVFIQKIADNRGVSTQTIIDTFGKGAVLIAQDPDLDKPDAIKVGMIDGLATMGGLVPDNENNDTITAKNGIIDKTTEIETETISPEESIMDLKTLQADHQSLYQQVMADGIKQGAKQENDRVTAHLTMGEASGDMKLALECVNDGSELTASINAKYMAANMNKKAVDNRSAESEKDIETAASADDDADDGALADATAKLLGVE